MQTRRQGIGFPGALLLCLLSAGLPVWGDEAPKRSWEIGVVAGFVLPDDELIGVSGAGAEPTLGLYAGGDILGRWKWFADGLVADMKTETFAGDAQTLAGRIGVELHVDRTKRTKRFFSGGWGFSKITFDNATDYDSGFASLGVGQHVPVAPTVRLRWEARVDYHVADEGLRGENLTEARGTIGVSWGFGRVRSDVDGDGVREGGDRCPGTPAGATVNSQGCPQDPDGDGVPDGLEMCPDTAAGWPVDASGCPLDSDGDGRPDGEDACSSTVAGATVDDEGCALDSDGDGVSDGIDRCTNTMTGIDVDATGCFLDADGDGVYDGLDMDRCPGTPEGAVVDRFGCPLDGDGDGVYDGLDRCPDTPAGGRVDESGCPIR